jgi:hypothetical protein
LGEEIVEGGPGGAGDEHAVGDGLVHGEVDEGAFGEADFGGGAGVGAALFAFEGIGGGEELGAVAYRGDGLFGFVEVANDVENLWIEADVFDGAAAGDEEAVVGFGFDFVERGVELEIVAEFFGVALVAFEIVDAGADELAGLFAGADGVDGMADHEEGLESDEDFVVFDVVADEHEDFLGHVRWPPFGLGGKDSREGVGFEGVGSGWRWGRTSYRWPLRGLTSQRRRLRAPHSI